MEVPQWGNLQINATTCRNYDTTQQIRFESQLGVSVELIETPRTGVCQLLSFSWFKKSFQRFGDAPRLAVRSFDRSSRCRRAAACCHFGCTRVTHCTYLYLMFEINMGTSMSPYPKTGSKFWITGDNDGVGARPLQVGAGIIAFALSQSNGGLTIS